MTWVKICGITNLEDALMAVEAGADALGFVFYEKSPRYIRPERARRIIEGLPTTIEKFGVFAQASAEDVNDVVTQSGATAVQVFVDVEPPDGRKAECARCFEQLKRNRPLKIVPVLSMQQGQPEGPAMMWHPGAVYAFLLDSGSAWEPGGTGKRFDWTKNEAALKTIKALANVIVAGGLTPSNVSEAMRMLKPWGVDVSSGVEAGPGKKDPDKVRAFIAAVREEDAKH
jgi:phosphoribosylanthranilate isomerase